MPAASSAISAHDSECRVPRSLPTNPADVAYTARDSPACTVAPTSVSLATGIRQRRMTSSARLAKRSSWARESSDCAMIAFKMVFSVSMMMMHDHEDYDEPDGDEEPSRSQRRREALDVLKL